MADPDQFFARTGITLIDEAELDGSAVTPEVFGAWRAPRRGTVNPERMDNPLWDWLIRTSANAWSATQRFGGPSAFDAGPGWCFDRFGQPAVRLPDGRVIFIAGEHEDHYDPDFFIYNDVVVRHPDGRIEVFGYPEEEFPPTDFHTATLSGDRIVLIGNLGYLEQRLAGVTQVVVLELKTWEVRMVPCTGEGPGWLHSHRAELAEDGKSINVSRGLLDPVMGDDRSLRENIDDWCLRLEEWRWERLTRRQWPRKEILRKDGKRLQLWELEQVFSPARVICSNTSYFDTLSDVQLPGVSHGDFRRMMEEMQERENQSEARLRQDGLSLDRELVESLLVPPVPHDTIESDEEEWRTKRYSIEGVTVRYKDDEYTIQLTVEGDLPPALVEQLTADLHRKLEKLQAAPCLVRSL